MRTITPTMVKTLLLSSCTLAVATALQGQTAPVDGRPTDAEKARLNKYDLNRNGRLDPDELKTEQAYKPTTTDGDTLVLSSFEVVTDKDDGFAASSAGSGGRLNMEMEDVAAPYSSMTREFIDTLMVTNLVEAATWSPNAGAVPDGQGVDVFGNPNLMQNRGQIVSTNGQRNFSFSASVMDSYNLERFEFGRGPNAGLFNISNGSNDNPLAGGISATGKKARVDRAFTTVAQTAGSWDYYRATLDINQPIAKNLAVRLNSVYFDRHGWRMNEFEKTEGMTFAATYLPRPKTMISVEGIADAVQRSLPMTLVQDKLSGWDGLTTFSAPITDAQLAAMGGTTGLNRLGTERRTGNYYVYVPGASAVMNYQNEGLTMRGDENANVPLYTNGVANFRGSGLPFGNGGNNTGAPTMTTNPGNDIWFLGQNNLPADRFDRVIANSKFRMPSRRFTYLADNTPVFEQHNKAFNAAVTHQFTENLIAEIGGDINEAHDARAQNSLNFRSTRLDINRNLPDGTPNPYFLQPYGDGAARNNNRVTSNAMVRFNLAWKKDLGTWGKYHTVLNLLYASTKIEDYDLVMSTAAVGDPRVWSNGVLLVNYRYYWGNPNRPYNELGDLPAQLQTNQFSSANVLTGATTTTLAPRWVLQGWGLTDKKNLGVSLPTAAEYRVFGRRLVFTAVPRFDSYYSKARRSPLFGDLPADWDGKTLIYRPDAPSDWYSLSYLTKNANGQPNITTPLAATTRPRINTTISSLGNTNLQLGLRNPLYSGDRFRDDYNPPVNEGHAFSSSFGGVYHLFPWMSAGLNYASSYAIPPVDVFTLNNELVEARTGWGVDGSLRLRFFNQRLSMNVNYFKNVGEKVRVGSPVVDQANTLLSQQVALNSVTGERNTRGIANFANNDYQKQNNMGFELEVVGRITKGLRVMVNGGTTRQSNFDQYEMTDAWLRSWDPTLQLVLQDAGGRLTGGTQTTGAPGLAEADPSITPVNLTARNNAVNAYNNMWATYSGVIVPARSGRQNIVTYLKANAVVDYTVQTGRLKGLMFGGGVQWFGGDRSTVAGNQVGQSILNSSGQVVDDPSVDAYSNVWVEQPLNTTAYVRYTVKIFKKAVDLQLNLKNVLNEQAVIYQDSGVTLRPPGGDLTVPYRVATASRVANYQQPISFLFTTTIRL